MDSRWKWKGDFAQLLPFLVLFEIGRTKKYGVFVDRVILWRLLKGGEQTGDLSFYGAVQNPVCEPGMAWWVGFKAFDGLVFPS